MKQSWLNRFGRFGSNPQGGNYLNIEPNGFLAYKGITAAYRDEYPSSAWTSAGGAAAPDDVDATISGITYRLKSFDGATTEERWANGFEIAHDVFLDAINSGTLSIEVHIHSSPSNNNSGICEWWFDYCYLPVNAAPIAQASISIPVTITGNQQYYNMVQGAVLPKPSSNFNIGDKILFNMRRTPSGAGDTYGSDMLFLQCALHVPIDTMGSRQRYVK
jgi:hypothetical protein